MDFDAFYRDTSRRLLRYAYGLTGDPAEAQDLVQEAYARGWQRWRRLTRYEDPEAWLRLVVNRLATDRWRRLGVRRQRAEPPQPPVEPPSENVVLLVTAMRRLPAAQRRALALHYLLDRSVALGGAGSARRRGRQRSQLRAGLSTALAVALIAAGVMVWRPATPQPLPATDGPLVGSPLSLGGEVAASRAATDGRRAYLAWVRQDDNSLWVTAADLRTGASAWPAPRALAGSSATLERVVSVPGAVLVVTRSEQARIVYALNPSTGALLWDRSRPAGSSLVFTERALVVTDTDRTHGVDWASGRVAWTVNGDRPVRALGMGVASDEERIDRSGPPATFSDDRVVVVTADGLAQVRDAGTGRLLREVAVGPGDPASMVAQDGRLYARDRTADRDGPQRIRSTDLIGTGGTVEVGTADGHFLRLAACGPARVCSVTQGHAGPPVLTAFDVHTGQRAWLSTTGPRGGDVVSSAHGRIMVQGEGGAGLDFFDASGITVYSAAAGGWLGPDTLVVPNPDGSKALSRWSAVDASLTPLNIPYLDLIGGCTSTTDRLACATGRSFKIFRVR